MYDELVKRLWECASGECFNCSQYTENMNASVCKKELMKQAADAIEELQATLCNWCAVCPYDKRDLSTCEIYESCRAKPPKGEHDVDTD